MEKTAKIVKTSFVSEWAGTNGIVYYHKIDLDNGDTGQIGTKEKMPSKLNPGSELTYTIESTSRGNKIKAVTSNFKPGGRPPVDPRIQMISMAMSYSKDLIVADKVKIDLLEKTFERIYNIMIAKI
jgi:hypothetical protein